MRYRVLSDTGDYTFGQGAAEFLVNSPDAVAQAVKTRLFLAQGDWFLDLTEGTPYRTEILGNNLATYDQAIQARIISTQGVLSILSYQSLLDQNRKLTVNVTLNTVYGTIPITQVL